MRHGPMLPSSTSKEYLDADLQYQKDNGIFPNLLTVRNDIDLNNYVKDFPADIAEGAKKRLK